MILRVLAWLRAVWPNAEVSDGGGHQASEFANRRCPPPFAPPKSWALRSPESLLPFSLVRQVFLLFPSVSQRLIQHLRVIAPAIEMYFSLIHRNNRVRVNSGTAGIVVASFPELCEFVGSVHEKLIGLNLRNPPRIMREVVFELDY